MYIIYNIACIGLVSLGIIEAIDMIEEKHFILGICYLTTIIIVIGLFSFNIGMSLF